jgi:hypothetical protein
MSNEIRDSIDDFEENDPQQVTIQEPAAAAGVDTVWHYTDAGGVLGVLSNDELWASSALHMNDTAELQLGIRRVQEAFESMELSAAERNIISNLLDYAEAQFHQSRVFILSASEDEDSLSQWRAYGGSSGYAIGLDAKERFDVFSASDQEPDPDGVVRDTGQYVSGWLRVAYDAKEQRSLVEGMIRELGWVSRLAAHDPDAVRSMTTLIPDANVLLWAAKDPNSFLLRSGYGTGKTHAFVAALSRSLLGPIPYAETVARVKDEGFADEREMRVFAIAQDDQRFHHIRAGRFGLTPYVKLSGAEYASEVRRVSFARSSKGKLPIRAIRVGPTPHTDAAVSGLRAALDRFGYPEVDVLVSEVPYR